MKDARMIQLLTSILLVLERLELQGVGLETHKVDEVYLDNYEMYQKFKISRSTLYRLKKKGELPTVKIGAKDVFPLSVVEAYLKNKAFIKV